MLEDMQAEEDDVEKAREPLKAGKEERGRVCCILCRDPQKDHDLIGLLDYGAVNLSLWTWTPRPLGSVSLTCNLEKPSCCLC
jgi:hypothetical protein